MNDYIKKLEETNEELEKTIQKLHTQFKTSFESRYVFFGSNILMEATYKINDVILLKINKPESNSSNSSVVNKLMGMASSFNIEVCSSLKDFNEERLLILLKAYQVAGNKDTEESDTSIKALLDKMIFGIE